MAAVLFWTSFVIWLFIAINSIVLKKRIIGLNIFVLTGIYVPMLFFFLGWSLYVDPNPSEEFYFIFICLNTCLILYNLVIKDGITIDTSILPAKVSKGFIYFINSLFVVLFFLESYLGSGVLIPSMHGIDIHTYSAPMIAFITRNLYVFVLVNLIAAIVTKEKKYAVFAALLILLPVATRNMRISSVIALVQVISFLMCVLSAHRRQNGIGESHKKIQRGRNGLKIVFVAAFTVLLISTSATMTNDRMSHYGKYDLSYSSEIAYTGPDVLSDIMSVYYGYFPMSFNNLNLSLKHGETNPNFIGLYSFKSLYYGLLQWDNLFGLNPAEPDEPSHRVTSSPSSTVATAFWDYYYDYNYLCFIPIGLMILICGCITRRMQTSPTLYMLTQYFYFIPLVFFQSFQNVFYSSEVVYELLIAAIVIQLAFPHKGNTPQVRNV